MKNNKDVVVPIKCDSHEYHAYFNNSYNKICTSKTISKIYAGKKNNRITFSC